MELQYRSNKIRKYCESPKEAQRIYGAQIGTKLTQRVGELKAATSLEDIRNIPAARLHRLQGQRADEYAVDLVHPFRLVFKPILDEGEDITQLANIKIVRIEEVRDYHGKQR
ncbi:MAG: type II toxin-antitoxin system RelE/ParE family toxin [Syntrophomonadaceae bacterium]|nr:type II toxin-antitoxin system RelE/ParE family toxin [Syntrophomonadaceae bacterium]